MAEDVKDDVTEIPIKRRKLDSDVSDLSIQQECTSSNNSATEKSVSLGDLPSTSTGRIYNEMLFSPLSRFLVEIESRM